MQGSGSVRIRRSKRASVALEAAIGAVVLTAASAYGLQAYQEIALATDLKRMTTVLAESVAKFDIARNVGASPTSLQALHPGLAPFFAQGGPVQGIAEQFLEQYGGVPDAMNVHRRTIDLDRVEVEAALIDFRAISLSGGSVGDIVSALDQLLEVQDLAVQGSPGMNMNVPPINSAQVASVLSTPGRPVTAQTVDAALLVSGLTIDDINTFLDIYRDLGNSGNRANIPSGGTLIFLPRFLGPSPTDTTYQWSVNRPAASSSSSCMNSGNPPAVIPLTVQNVLDGTVFGGLQAELSGILYHSPANPGVRGKPFLADHVQAMALVRSCVRIRNRIPILGLRPEREFMAFHAIPISDQLVPFGGDDSQSSLAVAGTALVSCWGALAPNKRNGYGILECLIP